ncbi:hypothetical protein CONPUDRAFT_113157 [Coniophora puteana RWD-64-598 SS2]|uniref:guanosine-diphosphatase n=1 Tax=Coniophora puteana (strain RWD-64-598) TaxID=741705 RepID=R7SHR2_CONPW|nr:uncharacterized protein CONPUDRAFT_113157 [Coniophora puteana RWD-64-598 SS2]EIW74609.1 hypothetical protein CONPUDRAFT_113157 [Coniophora puteana RWD-64-598 SS2]
MAVFTPSPRSPTYDRLEAGGMGGSRIAKRLAWRKIAVGVVVLLGLVYFFGPSPDTVMPDFPSVGLEDVYVPPVDTSSKPPGGVDLDTPPRPDIAPPSSSSDEKTLSTKPTSPETDPDPLKTVHCTSPHDSSSPLVQYALMIDAGSTGSRIHVYKFHNCGPAPAFEYEVFKMTQPGLSDYSGRPTDAAKSLDELLDVAMQTVPASLRKCTPVAVKATAGLRMLGAAQAQAILDAVEKHLKEDYPFPLPDKEGVVIMDGKDEGVYAWITANYLLGTISSGAADPAASKAGSTAQGGATYAVLDLGGGSTQIVFEPEAAAGGGRPDDALQEGEHRYELAFGGRTRVLYQHSYLGFGLKSARGAVHALVDFMQSLRAGRGGKGHTGHDAHGVVPSPCLARGTSKEVEVTEGDVKRTVAMSGADVGNFDACRRVVELVMAKDAVCELKPCSFDGVYQPSLLDTFPTGNILLLSYFYDRITPLLAPAASASATDKPPQLSISTVASLATDVCAGKKAWTDRWGGDEALLDELEGRPEWCLDLTFMHSLLTLGYGFVDERDVSLGKRVDGTELGWCLGATIAMVGGEVTCRA